MSTSIPTTCILTIAAFSAPKQAVALRNLNKETRQHSEQVVKEHYERIFGCLPKGYKQEISLCAKLICCGEQSPTFKADHNSYQAPYNPIERIKWVSGLKNQLDDKVQKIYEKKNQLIEHTQAQSIIQLKNQLQAYSHNSQELKDYLKYKKSYQNKLIGQFLSYTGKSIMGTCYPLSSLSFGAHLQERSQKCYAILGSFITDDSSYNIIAFHEVGDERSPWGKKYFLDREKPFYNTTGATVIAFFPEDQVPHYQSLYDLPHFEIRLAWESSQDSENKRFLVETGPFYRLLAKADCAHLKVSRPINTIYEGLVDENMIERICEEIKRQNPYILSIRGVKSRSLQEPILKPKAGMLPRYWCEPPHFS